QLENLNELWEEGIIPTEEEYMEIREGLEQQHQDALAKIEKAGADERMKAAQQESAARQQVMAGMMNNLTQLMNSGNREMFNIGKAAAIAQALVKGYQAVVNSYEAGTRIGGPVVGAAFAATAAAATAGQIASIRNQSYNSGGSVSARTGGT